MSAVLDAPSGSADVVVSPAPISSRVAPLNRLGVSGEDLRSQTRVSPSAAQATAATLSATLSVVLVAETTGALVVPCAEIGLYVCVASPEFGRQTDRLMPPSVCTADVRDFD